MDKDPFTAENQLYFCVYFDKKSVVRKRELLGYFMMAVTISGRAKVTLNGVPYEINRNRMLVLHPHIEAVISDISDDFRVCCIGTMMEMQNNVTYNIPPSFMALVLQHPIWEMDDETVNAVQAFCTIFNYNYNNIGGVNSSNIAVSLLSVFIQGFYERTKHMIPSLNSELVSIVMRNLISRFMNELRANYKNSHQVSYYAERVCVSPKYLTQVVKQVLGLTPKEIIDRKLSVESMYLLGRSNKSIQEISNELGFPDQSYFGRFFKRLLGMSPLAFRRNPDMRYMSRLKQIRNAEFWNIKYLEGGHWSGK